MMKIFRIFQPAFLFLAGPLLAQEKLTISPSMPERNQEITITYDPSAPGAAIPASATSVEMIFTYSNFYEVASKIAMEKVGQVWQTKILVPRYATYATFYLQGGDVREQPASDKHFAIPVFENGKRVFSGYLYEGYSISAQTGKVPDLAARQAALYEKELASFPDNYEAKLRLLQYKISLASGEEKEKLTKQAEDIIAAKFYENPGNTGYMNKTTMGYLIIGQNSRVDSVREVVKVKYPETESGYSLRIADIRRMSDKDLMAKKMLALLKGENSTNAQYLKGAHSALMEYYAAKKQTAKALYHYRKLEEDDTPYRAEILKERAEMFYNAGIALDTALALANRSLSIAHTYPVGLIRHFPETGHILSFVDKETRLRTTNRARGNLLSLIGLIKLKQGKSGNTYIAEALNASSDNETLSNVAEYYRRTGANKLAFETYKKIMFQAPEDTTSLKKMKASYVAWRKGSAGYDVHIAELNKHWNEETLKQLKKDIINITPPDYAATFVNLRGEPVRKEDLKNKIVVLNFWATWCVPCMHEMPYMQRVYDQYRNDPGVAFLIVNSGSKNTIDDARGWWGNKKYSFPVFYNNDPMMGEKLKFNVIPATYILDTKGNIRFKTIGFEGAAVERKMKGAIDLLKQM